MAGDQATAQDPAATAAAEGSAAAAEEQRYGGTMRFLDNARGERLALYFWPARAGTPQKGIIQLLHSHGCYIAHQYLLTSKPGATPEYEGSWLQRLNDAGYAIFGHDIEGYGHSGGLRCYCNSFQDIVDDALLVSCKAREMGGPSFAADRPLFLMGPSMGGCLATCMSIASADAGVQVAGMCLLAPMLSLEELSRRPVNRILRPLINVLNWLSPKLQAAKVANCTKFPDIQAKFDGDPLNYTAATRVRVAAEYLRVTGEMMGPGGMEKVTTPFIVFHSQDDTMCEVHGSQALFKRASSTDKTFEAVDSMWHILTKEPGNEDVLAKALAWFNARAN
mmetsp:Transcript_36610/g.108055  ORF Transcript_36610/g.108055 Transcript_36610/m.108055 type:complete len:335 (-) Transcript_36610:197-1201(-)